MGPTIIATERLRLRTWCAEDAPGLLALGQDPLVMRFITGGRPLAPHEAQEFVARQLEAQEVRGWSRWALELRSPSAEDPHGIVGFCGPGCTFAPEIEVGWWLDRRLWRRRLATEAAKAAVGYCFGTVGFPRLISAIAPENIASRRVAEHAGFTLESEFLHHGQSTLRYSQMNPDPDPRRDARFRLDCEGAPTTSILKRPEADEH